MSTEDNYCRGMVPVPEKNDYKPKTKSFLLVRMRGCLPHLYIFELEVEEVVVQLIVAAGKCSATASGLQAEDERSAMRTHIVNNGFLLLLHLG